MSLVVENLTKVFGNQRAVDNISFSVRKGEILGFLGPNGAGKSTTMKIATTYLPPTSGSVTVNGRNVNDSPLDVKKLIGYLPEHNPLYLDLYVHEYLQFVGKLYGLSGERLRMRVREIIALCGLEIEQHKKIEMLSKGYRQRVGLAQALIHDPEVLILDEPTTGLDPNQILEIRELIRSISRDKTVVFSTHIMQEVQALCERVVVINKGQVVADDRLENLLRRGQGTMVVSLEVEKEIDATAWKSIPGIEEMSLHSRSDKSFTYRIVSVAQNDIRPTLFKFAAEQNILLLSLKQEESSMETIFRELTRSENKIEQL